MIWIWLCLQSPLPPLGEDEFVQEEEEVEEPAPVVPKPTVDITASSTDYGMFSAEQLAEPSDASEVCTHPDSSDRLCGSHIMQYCCGYCKL